MKILHLSDLHIGKSVNGFSMYPEQQYAFTQIINYIQTHHPDAVIISGDIYDRAVPGVEAVRLFDDFLTELAGEDTAVLIISGNHDSPERLNYASRLLADKRLYLYTTFDGTLHRIVLKDAHGDVTFWLLPFIRPSSLRGFFAERSAETYEEAFAMVLETADIDHTTRNILVSHQYFTHAATPPIRSDSELTPIGGLDAIDATLIESFDYAALGHLHGTQSAGPEHLHYAGSPIKYSFSERFQEKTATLVTLEEKGDLTITPLPLTPIHDMREIKGTLDTLVRDSLFEGSQDYLRVILTDEEEIVDPMGKLRSVFPNIMSLAFENTRTKIDPGTVTAHAGTAPKTLSPYELFCEFYLDLQGSTMNAAQTEIVREYLESQEEL
ncbi:MAG: exonuclease SbcCD subunit D [Peptococcaceae bacterium]|nr:exonuclease SbcCD subunit D [Peptococcaceae bacterium]